MKKLLIMAFAMVAMSISSVSAQNAMILLQHNGSAKMYQADQLATAINAAAAGDTIYLNKGYFGDGNEITINKAITIIGAGGNITGTKITGSLKIAINGTPTLTATLLEGVYVNGNISITEPLSGLKIKRSQFYTFDSDAIIDNTEIVQCFIGIFRGRRNLKNCVVFNSKLKYLDYSCTNVTFVNCNIRIFGTPGDPFDGTVINSIIGCDNTPQSSASFTNCLYYQIRAGVLKDCYKHTSEPIDPSSLDCTLNKNTLISNNYLGNDGTVVGVEGGTVPFTLDPSVPQVESSTIKVDVPGQKLNVSIKVKAN